MNCNYPVNFITAETLNKQCNQAYCGVESRLYFYQDSFRKATAYKYNKLHGEGGKHKAKVGMDAETSHAKRNKEGKHREKQ